MRVVSQSRNFSFDFDRTVFWRQSDVIYAKIGGESIAIGKYKSDERAAGVFEDMHRAYAPVYSISDGLSKEQIESMIVPSKNIEARNVLNAGQSMYITTFDNYVYYMPEE